MPKDTPISTQLPEWKKEVAEKVKAYGERKKRLTTPPHPLKESSAPQPGTEIPVKQSIPIRQKQPESVAPPKRMPKPVHDDDNPVLLHPVEPVVQPALEIWTDDIQELSRLEKLSLEEPEEQESSAHSFLMRRIGAGLIDHVILILITAAALFGFSMFLNQSMEWLVLSNWKGSFSFFLFLHFIYHLYFYRSSRQTPGMLFVSLELRDPVLKSIPVSKLIFRWIFFIVFNIFNFLPLFLGREYLLLDRLSETEIRSFN